MKIKEEESKPIGIGGQRHKAYLTEHRKATYTTMLMEGKLNSCLADIDNQAQERLETLVEQMKQAEGITEQLKAENAMEWVQKRAIPTQNGIALNLLYRFVLFCISVLFFREQENSKTASAGKH